MYTLKIRWLRYKSDSERQLHVVDESNLFIPADNVTTHGLILSMDEMKEWDEGSYFDYHIEKQSARLIRVERNNESTWYLASHAWLMSDTGKTIERLI